MTRSMGDYYLLQAGLSHKPSIIKTDLNNTSAILLSSDGLWDNWKKNELLNYYFRLLNTNNTDRDIFNLISTKTKNLAKKNYGKSHDDITAIMIIF